MRARGLTIGLLTLIVAGCATTTSTANDPALQPRVYSASYDRVWSEAINAVASISWEITHTEKQSGIINATTPMSLLTYGDKVTVRVINMDPDRVRVEVTSSTDQAYDWGKNGKNIGKFYQALDKGMAIR